MCKKLQLLGDFVSQTPYRGFAFGPHWGTSWHYWLGDRKGIRSVKKNWMLVCWWWWFGWSCARLIASVVQLSPPPPSSFASINIRFTWKMAVKMERVDGPLRQYMMPILYALPLICSSTRRSSSLVLSPTVAWLRHDTLTPGRTYVPLVVQNVLRCRATCAAQSIFYEIFTGWHNLTDINIT